MLKKINFSEGIRSTEIEENFLDLQSQLNKERISVAGSGISYGLDCLLEGFNLSVAKGCLISFDGEEIFIDKANIKIEKPILIERVDQLLKVDENHRIYLSEIPYSLDRDTTADNCPLDRSGIEVYIAGMTGETSRISVVNVSGNAVTVPGDEWSSLEGTLVNVKYKYTKKRRDVIYIDKDYNVKCMIGTTSSSPSVLDIDEEDYVYKIGYIEVNGHTLDEEEIAHASCKFIKEYKSVRNVYSDAANNLYLCGTPFESISIIHMIEPDNPKIDTMWYDQKVNKLKIWKHTDKFEFADTIIHESSDVGHPQKFKTIVPYLYNTKQIAVYINGTRLMDNEFEEGSDLEISEKVKGALSSEFRIIKKVNKDDSITYKIDRYDGYAEWVSINDSSYITAQERFIWSPEKIDYIQDVEDGDGQTFLFHAIKNKNLMYVPNKNSLQLVIDQQILNSDQYEEITLHDAIASNEIKNRLVKYHGFSGDLNINTIHEEYENVGVGFRLNAKLDKPVYMECIVSQRINANPLTKRFQRSATFASENAIEYKTTVKKGNEFEYNPPIFETTAPFRFGENQLDVFLNGRRLDRNVHFKEGMLGVNHLLGENIVQFSLLSASDVQDGDIVSYRIESTIYSYDHVEGLLSKFNGAIEDIKQKVDNASEKVETCVKQVKEYTEEIRDKMDTILNIEEGLDAKYMAIDKKIDINNLSTNIVSGIADGLINKVYTISQSRQKINVTSIMGENDYVVISNVTSNNILCRGSDFNILREGEDIYLSIFTNSVGIGHQIYLSGIRFNRI